MIEYADSIYAHTTIQTDTIPGLSGIPNWAIGIWGNIDYGNIGNVVGNITIVDDPVGGGNANVVAPGNGTVIGNIDYGNIDFSGIGGGMFNFPSINFPITIPDIPDIAEIEANVVTVGSSVPFNPGGRGPDRHNIRPPNNRATFEPGEVINVSLPQPVLPPQDQFFGMGPITPDILANIDFGFLGIGGNMAAISTAANIALAPKGGITRGSIGDVQAGVQIEDDVANVNGSGSANVQNSNTEAAGGTVFNLGNTATQITPIDVIDMGGIDEGIYSSINGLVPYGAFGLGSRIGFQPQRKITYDQVAINALTGVYTPTGNTVFETVSGSGIISTTNDVIPSLTDNFEYEVSRARGGIVGQLAGGAAPSPFLQYIPANVSVFNFANTNLTEIPADNVYRGFDVTNSDKRISKSDAYVIPRYGCFIAGSMVLMADGVWKEIEFVVIGEKVIGLNGVTNTVTKLHHHPVAQQVIYTINNLISLTDTHPMLTVEGWKSFKPELTAEMHPDLELAGKLMIGDTLITHTGPDGLYDYTKKVQDIPVYNLDVDGDDTFIVDGYVVHNK